MEYYNKIVINGIEYPLEVVIIGGGVPTSATPGNIGQLYANSAEDYELYICVSKTSAGLTTWQKVVTSITTSEISSIVNAVS